MHGARISVRTKHEKLRVWADAMTLTEEVYRVTRSFPRREDFALTTQIRKAAVSIPANIAEGCGRYHTREFIQFLYVARGSLFELMTLLDLSRRSSYLDEDQYSRLRAMCEQILSGLSGLIRSLEARRLA